MTFLELIVVLGIFGAIAATVLFNYHDFSSNVSLQNLAQDVALQIKRTQTDAVSGKAPTLSANQELNIANLVPIGWQPSYGAAFDISGNWASGNKAFIYYFNKDDDTVGGENKSDFYDFERSTYTAPCGSDEESECLEEINISSGDIIDMICFDYSDNDIASGECNDGNSAETAYISFRRPRANAKIMEFDDGSPSKGNVFIRITSPQGGHRFISVWESGYITIK